MNEHRENVAQENRLGAQFHRSFICYRSAQNEQQRASFCIVVKNDAYCSFNAGAGKA